MPGCRSVIRLDKEIRHPQKGISYETRYYISSLDPDKVPASRFQEYIWGHWEVENCLHWQKDRHHDEDKHAVKQDWGVAWTILTNMGLSLGILLQRGEGRCRRCVSVVISIRYQWQGNSLGYRETCWMSGPQHRLCLFLLF